MKRRIMQYFYFLSVTDEIQTTSLTGQTYYVENMMFYMLILKDENK